MWIYLCIPAGFGPRIVHSSASWARFGSRSLMHEVQLSQMLVIFKLILLPVLFNSSWRCSFLSMFSTRLRVRIMVPYLISSCGMNSSASVTIPLCQCENCGSFAETVVGPSLKIIDDLLSRAAPYPAFQLFGSLPNQFWVWWTHPLFF